jgi:peptidoglycan/LPS O-acetylase OafA/YrhL
MGDSAELNKGIEALRGVAIALVVLFHLGVNAFSTGYLGVDVFFIISGYLMMSLYGKITPGFVDELLF